MPFDRPVVNFGCFVLQFTMSVSGTVTLLSLNIIQIHWISEKSMKAFSHCFELSIEFAVASKTLAIYVLLANVSYSLRTYPNTCPTLKNV